jgi:hypothetical protein
MTVSELGSLGELIAAVATIATLAYLALQIRQSNRANALVAIARIAESTEDWLGSLSRDPELYSLYRDGILAPDSLSKEEFGRFQVLILQFLRGVESGWLQVRWRLIDNDYWVGFERSLAFIIGSPGGRRAYERNKGFLSDEFAGEVDRILDQSKSASRPSSSTSLRGDPP